MAALASLVIARLQAQVPALRSVEGAAAFAALVERQAFAQHTPAAHVIPSGLRGGAVTAMAGAFVQETDEVVTVVLTLRANDRVGAAGIEPVEVLKQAVIEALAGWAPGDEIGVFRLLAGRMSNVSGGALAYQIEFAIADQVRIYA